MTKPYILAIDPGVTTGMALVKREGPEVIWSVEVPEQQDAGVLIEDTLAEHYIALDIDVVVENYLITKETIKKTRQTASLELIGVAKHFSISYTNESPTLYTPSESKTFSTNYKLRSVGLWHVGGAGHANDALRLALLYMVNTGFSDLRLLRD